MALTDRQKALGWVEGTVAEFLGLSDEEQAKIEALIAEIDLYAAKQGISFAKTVELFENGEALFAPHVDAAMSMLWATGWRK